MSAVTRACTLGYRTIMVTDAYPVRRTETSTPRRGTTGLPPGGMSVLRRLDERPVRRLSPSFPSALPESGRADLLGSKYPQQRTNCPGPSASGARIEQLVLRCAWSAGGAPSAAVGGVKRVVPGLDGDLDAWCGDHEVVVDCLTGRVEPFPVAVLDVVHHVRARVDAVRPDDVVTWLDRRAGGQR